MGLGLAGFMWQRCTRGHSLQPIDPLTAEDKHSNFMLVEESKSRDWCSPLANDSALFWHFAQLESGEIVSQGLRNLWGGKQSDLDRGGIRPAIIAFANAHGLLTVTNHLVLAKPARPPRASMKALTGAVRGERLEFWINEITAMRHATTVWDAIRASDSNRLSRFFSWVATQYDHYVPVHREGGKEHILGPERLSRARCDISTLASEWLAQYLNEHVGTAHPVITYHHGDETFSFKIRPPDLRTALWLQFQLAVLNDNEFRKCEVCGKWMEISPQTARINRQFCSNACKVKAYRQRKDRAVELRAEGMPLRAIAKKLGSDLETVRGWLASAKKGDDR